MRKSLAIVTATMIAAGLGSHVAMSHVVETPRSVFWEGVNSPYGRACAVQLSLVAHGNYGRGFARSNTETRYPDYAFGGQCSVGPEWRRDYGKNKARFTYLRKTNGNYAFCQNSDWVVNWSGIYVAEAYRNWANPPCAKGFYRNQGSHKIEKPGSGWTNESYSLTGEHYFE